MPLSFFERFSLFYSTAKVNRPSILVFSRPTVIKLFETSSKTLQQTGTNYSYIHNSIFREGETNNVSNESIV